MYTCIRLAMSAFALVFLTGCASGDSQFYFVAPNASVGLHKSGDWLARRVSFDSCDPQFDWGYRDSCGRRYFLVVGTGRVAWPGVRIDVAADMITVNGVEFTSYSNGARCNVFIDDDGTPSHGFLPFE